MFNKEGELQGGEHIYLQHPSRGHSLYDGGHPQGPPPSFAQGAHGHWQCEVSACASFSSPMMSMSAVSKEPWARRVSGFTTARAG